MTITPAPQTQPAGLLAGLVAGLVAGRTPGRSLDAAFYTSDDVFTADIEAVFAAQWVFVASVAEVPEAGDFVTVQLGSYSVIVLRDDDERVRAFHNVCRHRGARILTEAGGSVGNIVCGYHRWTYGTDGQLLHAPSTGPGFDASCFGLRTVQVLEVAGLVFACLAETPPTDLADVAGVLAPYLAPHRLDRTKVAAQVDLVEEGNWKLVMENNRECYHCEGHPELVCSLFPTYGYSAADVPPQLRGTYERYLAAQTDLEVRCDRLGLPHAEVEELDTRVAGFRVQREPLDGAGESFSASGAAMCRRLLGDLDERRLGRLSMHLQPNSWFHLLSDHAVTFSVLPISTGRTLVRTTWLVHEDAVEGIDYDVAALTEVWRRTNEQDAAFVARAQLGVSSPAYLPGPYLPNEYQVEAFCHWYVDRLAEHRG